VVGSPERVLLFLLREEAVDQRHPDEDGDHGGQVAPLVAFQERLLRRRGDLTRVGGVVGSEVLGARERELELALVLSVTCLPLSAIAVPMAEA
jgi:hypothetical protein